MKYDKIEHAGVCAFAALFMGILAALCGGHLGGAIIAALGTGLGLGAGKEFGDMCAEGNRWDWYDFLADALGTLAAVIVLVAAYFAKG